VPKSSSPHLQSLRDLAGQPDEQARLAVTLLDPRLGNEVVFAALQILQRDPPVEARPALFALYAQYEKQGRTRDPAANLRATVLRALRPLVTSADVPFLAQAAATYVFPPPAFKEEGAALRSAALNALSEVDETLARYHAIRLLANEYTDTMSGEPALTAARLLAALVEVAPLYFYVMQDGARTLPEVISEALRHLTAVPDSLLPALIERYGESEYDVVLVGLFDLLVNHRNGPHGLDFLALFLRTSNRLDAYRYLATVLLTSGRKALVEELLAAAQAEQRRDQLAVLAEALALMPAVPAIERVLAEVRNRIAKRKGNV
jgi:hypothetical protein